MGDGRAATGKAAGTATADASLESLTRGGENSTGTVGSPLRSAANCSAVPGVCGCCGGGSAARGVTGCATLTLNAALTCDGLLARAEAEAEADAEVVVVVVVVGAEGLGLDFDGAGPRAALDTRGGG